MPARRSHGLNEVAPKAKCSIIVEKADLRIEHWRHTITAYVEPYSLQFFKVRGYVDNKAILSALLNQSRYNMDSRQRVYE